MVIQRYSIVQPESTLNLSLIKSLLGIKAFQVPTAEATCFSNKRSFVHESHF